MLEIVKGFGGEMTRSAAISLLGSEFDEFLFAPVGEDLNGMLVSVLSALARLDLDPWQEAARLARLPGAAAAERLVSVITSLPYNPAPTQEPGTIATRLIALLPHSDVPKIRPHWKLPGSQAPVNQQAIMCIMASSIFMVLVIGLQLINAHEAPATIGNTDGTPSHAAVNQDLSAK